MNYVETIKEPIQTDLECLSELFIASMKSDNPLLQRVLDFVVNRKGKMMRPILTLLAAKGVGECTNATYHAALTVEFLHTASLLHDDVVDESNERRGQPSINAAFNNTVSVLVGDFLLATSLRHAALSRHIRVVEAIANVGRTLADGEILQLSNIEESALSEDTYFKVIRKKTASLFEAAAMCGALTAGGSEEVVEAFRQFGDRVGVCFQIKDDIFDYFSEANIGKPTGNDMLEGKLTLPALYALNRCADESILAIVPKIKALEATPEEIATLVAYTKEHGGIDYATQVMLRYRDEALALLSNVSSPSVRTALEAFVNYVVERQL